MERARLLALTFEELSGSESRVRVARVLGVDGPGDDAKSDGGSGLLKGILRNSAAAIIFISACATTSR